MQKAIFIILCLLFTFSLHCSAQQHASRKDPSEKYASHDSYHGNKASHSGKFTKEHAHFIDNRRKKQQEKNEQRKSEAEGAGKELSVHDKALGRSRTRTTRHESYSSGGGYKKSHTDYKSTGLTHHA
ncbi:MAG TPA: hypothetical protein VK806_00315 [Bacteroidia bacterium]|jgi:hypothetical protein|nr:hypothetical protein [Bacteroidia bacterium]